MGAYEALLEGGALGEGDVFGGEGAEAGGDAVDGGFLMGELADSVGGASDFGE